MKKISKIVLMTFVILMISITLPSVMFFNEGLTTVEAASVKLNVKSKSVYVTKTYQLKMSGTKKTVKWTSSKTSVATVSSKGKVTAKKAGKATITAKVNNKKYTCKITVLADKTAPIAGTATFKTANGSVYTPGTWTNQTVNVTVINGSDSISGHKKTVSNLLTISASGNTAVIITTTDNSGNISTRVYQVKIDKMAPIAGTATFKTEDGKTYVSGSVTNQKVNTILTNGSDSLSGHKSTVVNKTTITAVGTTNVIVTTTDNAGNVATRSYNIIITTAGTRTSPYSLWTQRTVVYYDWLYETYATFKIQMTDYIDGEAANDFMQNEWAYNTESGVGQQWVVMKFNLNYISGNKEIEANDIINYYSNLYNNNVTKSVDPITYGIFSDNYKDIDYVSLYQGGNEDVYLALLVNTADCPLTFRIPVGYDDTNYETIYTWFTTQQ